MSGRDAVLSKIRRSLGVTGTETERRAAVTDRLQRAPRGLIPERGQLDPTARKALFARMAENVQASVTQVATEGDVPEAVANYLRSRNLPQKLKMGTDERLARLDFARKTPSLEVTTGPSDGSDLVSLSHAFGGVAETGTVIMESGADNPTTLNFLPDTHIVLVKAQDIAGDYESVWQTIREKYGKGVMPRTVNMITGPSRSGDIEQVLLLGAHGPRDLHIVVVG